MPSSDFASIWSMLTDMVEQKKKNKESSTEKAKRAFINTKTGQCGPEDTRYMFIYCLLRALLHPRLCRNVQVQNGGPLSTTHTRVFCD